MYSIKISQNASPKPTAIVKTSGDNTINTNGFVVDQGILESLKIAAEKWNEVCDIEYPENADGFEIARIDDLQEDAVSKMIELANDLAKSARKAA